MKLIVGLGNPGKEYENTRHNTGFMAIDHYLKNEKMKEKNNGEYVQKNINGQKVIFLKPLSYMNSSGNVVFSFVKYFNINIEDVLIIYDDADYDIGTFKLKPSGSGGSHNGVKDIVACLNTQDIKRLRIGISRNEHNMINHVLGRFKEEEMEKLIDVFNITDKIIDDFLIMDFERLMNKYNS